MWDCDVSADKIPDAVYRDFVEVESRETDVCGGVVEQTGFEIFSAVPVYTVETGTAGTSCASYPFHPPHMSFYFQRLAVVECHCVSFVSGNPRELVYV